MHLRVCVQVLPDAHLSVAEASLSLDVRDYVQSTEIDL